MQLISYKNNLINYPAFFNTVINREYIDGLSVPIIKTKDNEIIVFDDNMGKGVSTEILQGSTIEDLQETTIFSLDNLFKELSNLQNFNKRIILNVYPLITPILSNETIQYINNQNKIYVEAIKLVIEKYPNLDISLSSINTNLLQEIKRTILNHPLGLIVNTENPVYLEVDFYILRPIMLDEVIIKQELDIGKEIIIAISDSDDLSITYFFFIENANPLRNELLIKLTFLTGYPQILNNLLTS